MARLTFYVDTRHPSPRTGGRYELLERRDEIIDKLKELGIRLSMTDDGTYVYLCDEGVPTIGDKVTAAGRT